MLARFIVCLFLGCQNKADVKVHFCHARKRHTIKPGLSPLAWSDLKVGLASIVAPNYSWTQTKFWLGLVKLPLTQIWPLKKYLASNLKLIFFSSNYSTKHETIRVRAFASQAEGLIFESQPRQT